MVLLLLASYTTLDRESQRGHLTGYMTDCAIRNHVRALRVRVRLPTLSLQDCHRYREQTSQLTTGEDHHLSSRRIPPLTSWHVKTQSDLFNRQGLKRHCEAWVFPTKPFPRSSTIFGWLTPSLIKALGEEQFLEIVARSSADLRLNAQPESWETTIKYLIQ
jgi:hypothetical protein